MLAEAQNIAHAMGIPLEFTHCRKRKCQRTEERSEAPETPHITFRNSVDYVAEDSIIAKLTSRFQSFRDICNDFKGILKFQQWRGEDLKSSC